MMVEVTQEVERAISKFIANAKIEGARLALRVAAAHVDALAERIRDTAPWYTRRAVESEAKTLEGAAVMIRALDPAKIVGEG